MAICDIIPDGGVLLDCCAAPGGKTILLSDKFDKIYAFELHEHRAELIKQYALRMNKSNIEVITADSSIYDSRFDCSADIVLCDCPCSGFGVICENPDIKLNRDSNNIDELHDNQVAILNNCSGYVKAGGYLAYSTCSVFNEENDLTIEAFQPEKHGFEICEMQSPLHGEKTEYGIQFLPHISLGAGFYICLMRKKQ